MTARLQITNVDYFTPELKNQLTDGFDRLMCWAEPLYHCSLAMDYELELDTDSCVRASVSEHWWEKG